MFNHSREDGFTLTEMMVSTTVVLMVLAAALQTFSQGLQINDAGTQLADANQNLRAGTNQLARDIMMAGRIIGTEGVSLPTGAGVVFKRPGPVNLNFDLVADNPDNGNVDGTVQLPSISSGFQLGPTINGKKTDIITILTIDEFMPVLTAPPATAGAPNEWEGTLAPNGSYVTLPANSKWLLGDTTDDTPKIQVGDLVFMKNAWGNAIQTVTKVEATKISFENNAKDFFGFNRPNATTGDTMPLAVMKGSCTTATNINCNILTPAQEWFEPAVAGPPAVAAKQAPTVTLFKALMITYYVYVDNSVTPPLPPRLTRVLNHCVSPCDTPSIFDPQALAGVVEDLDLSYDLVDGTINPTAVAYMPITISGKLFSANLVRKVNIHMGVRSEVKSKPTNDYVRNHISTSVNVRSLSAVDRYVSGS